MALFISLAKIVSALFTLFFTLTCLFFIYLFNFVASLKNPCEGNMCEELCLLVPLNSFNCDCQDGFNFTKNSCQNSSKISKNRNVRAKNSKITLYLSILLQRLFYLFTTFLLDVY